MGLPTQRHENMTVVPSSDCLIVGRSTNVGLMSSGGGESSPVLSIKEPTGQRGTKCGGQRMQRQAG